MKIELPKDWTQVSLKQFQAIQAMLKDEGDVYQKNTELISILSGKDIKDIEKIALKGYTQILKVLEFINEPIENKLTNSFKLNGKKYRVISDIYKLNGGQYITLQHLLKDSESVIDNLHQIMAVFAVPYERKWWGWKRGKYDSDQHEEIAEEMLQLPISIAQPLSTFFFENWKRSVERMLESSERADERDREGADQRVETYTSKYGWIATINSLSNNDATKWDYFFDLQLREFLNLISFQKAKQAHDYQVMKQQNGGR